MYMLLVDLKKLNIENGQDGKQEMQKLTVTYLHDFAVE